MEPQEDLVPTAIVEPPSALRWRTMLAVPFAAGLALAVHAFIANREPPLETHSYRLLLSKSSPSQSCSRCCADFHRDSGIGWRTCGRFLPRRLFRSAFGTSSRWDFGCCRFPTFPVHRRFSGG